VQKNFDVIKHNKNAWNLVSKANGEWTKPFSNEVIENAKKRIWEVVLTQNKPVPKEWFPPLNNLKILGLASGGGQQIPIFAALDADVTSFDNSNIQLEKDILVARENQLSIKAYEGDMGDLACFNDATFDLVFNPVSTIYVPDVLRVYEEVYRVLKPGGRFMTGFKNPFTFIFDPFKKSKNIFEVKYTVPFDPIAQYEDNILKMHILGSYRLSYGHSLTQLIGYQTLVGFEIIDFYEDLGNDETSQFMSGEMATCSRKPIK
jgi:SAM-dependent methyltransferase